MKNNYNILCVDDDPSLLDIVTFNLKEYNLYVTTNAYEGIEILLKNIIDLILLDINMPELNGFAFCKIIKNEDILKDIPIIFITASTSDKDIDESFSLGGVDYIRKPINVIELKQRVKNHLKLRNYNLQLQENIQDAIDKNMKTEQVLLHRSELLNAVKLYLSKQVNKSLVKNDFQRIISESIELLKFEQNEPIINLGNNFEWHKKESILYQNDILINLNKSETNLLELFILKKNQKISLEQIHMYLWGDSSLTFNSTSVRNVVTKLRKKLPKNLITTVYGGDYILEVKKE
jgi:DNA-binding response OmpR family regulator